MLISLRRDIDVKMNIEIECTPEEVRALMGLPDVSKANEAYVDNVTKVMKGVTSLEQLEQLSKQIAPMGQMGLKLFQGLAEAAMSGGSKKPVNKDGDASKKEDSKASDKSKN